MVPVALSCIAFCYIFEGCFVCCFLFGEFHPLITSLTIHHKLSFSSQVSLLLAGLNPATPIFSNSMWRNMVTLIKWYPQKNGIHTEYRHMGYCWRLWLVRKFCTQAICFGGSDGKCWRVGWGNILSLTCIGLLGRLNHFGFARCQGTTVETVFLIR